MSLIVEISRYLIAVASGLLFALCVLGNWSELIGGWVRKRESGDSLVLPFLGPVFGILFLVAFPIPKVAKYWWVAPIVEPTWWIALAVVASAVRPKKGEE